MLQVYPIRDISRLSLGWGVLKIETNPSYSNEIQSYAAGLLEGILTANEIYIHSTNIYGEKKPNDHVKNLFSS